MRRRSGARAAARRPRRRSRSRRPSRPGRCQTAGGERGPIAMRRLTESQYRQAVADVFGDDITVGGRFEPENRVEGLLAVDVEPSASTSGSSSTTRWPARRRASVDPSHRAVLVPCQPAAPPTTRARAVLPGPAACCGAARRRRARHSRLARDAGRGLGDFHRGSGRTRRDAAAPEFLFLIESSSPTRARRPALDAPREGLAPQLLPVEHHPRRGAARCRRTRRARRRRRLRSQVDRLLDSPRLGPACASSSPTSTARGHRAACEQGSRHLSGLQPRGHDAEEQTLRIISEHLLTETATTASCSPPGIVMSARSAWSTACR